jgi:outer membrane protein assembly factor BamB
MGLLTVRTPTLAALLASTIALAGCSYLRLLQFPAPSADDWTMYGGTIGRTNTARHEIAPPLAPLWEYDASAGFGAASAAIAGSYLFVGNLEGDVHAIDIKTGKGAGSYDFGTALVGTPVIDGGEMYVALSRSDESLLAYNLFTGVIDWRAKLGDIESSPLLIGRRLYVTGVAGTLTCVETATGEAAWTYRLPQHVRTRTIRSSPASDGASIFFGADDGTVYAVRVNDGTLRWSAKTGGSVIASPSVALGKVYVGSLDNSFYAFGAETGSQIWKQPLGSRIYASQAVSDSSVYVGTAGRSMYRLDARSGAILWRASTGSVVNAAPLIAGSIVYVGCLDKTISAYSAATGELLWQYKTEGRIKSMPVASRDVLFVLAEDRSVLAFTHRDRR